MKKFLVTGFLVLILTVLLPVAAFANTGVAEGGSAPHWTYSATLDAGDEDTPTTITAGDMYLLVVIRTSSLESGGFPSSLTADDILYIDQKTADSNDAANNTVIFSNFIPMNYSGGTAFIVGGSLENPTYIGLLPSYGIMGNVDGDENGVTIIDARYILQYLAGSREFDSTQLVLGNVDGDENGVTIIDARYILQYLAGSRDEDFNPVD